MQTPRQIISDYAKRVSLGKSNFKRNDPRESLDMEISLGLDEDFHAQFMEPAVKAMWKRLNINKDRKYKDIDIDEFDHYAIAFSNALDEYMKQWKKFNRSGWYTGDR